MSDLKTKKNQKSVESFLESISDKNKKDQCFTILKLMEKLINERPAMWGDAIIGFGTYHYKYESGREGDFFLSGFSPRKQNISIYIMSGFSRYEDLLKSLGKYKTGKSCLYIKDLNDIDLGILEILILKSVEYMRNKKWP